MPMYIDKDGRTSSTQGRRQDRNITYFDSELKFDPTKQKVVVARGPIEIVAVKNVEGRWVCG